jgi:hypothetical protein
MRFLCAHPIAPDSKHAVAILRGTEPDTTNEQADKQQFDNRFEKIHGIYLASTYTHLQLYHFYIFIFEAQ